MERENDAQLIQDTLAGNDEAFNALVRKYQKSVHALAWRKIGDFQDAEEVTQDTFLRAYKNLSTLKNPHQFAGWLYVIANRLCLNWIQKQKSAIQSLEDTPMKEIENASYTHYESERRETAAGEYRLERAKKLLAKLPESERTVVTLYYLGEMTTREISRFLGVSVNTITSRLQRGRKRLQDDQEHLIKEVLGGRQIPARLSEGIKRQIADMKPTPSPAGKPLLPWSAFGTAVVVIILMLGVSSRYLVRFQRPYNFEAQSEPTIEIIEAPIVFDVKSKPDVRKQVGRTTSSDKSMGASLQPFEDVSTSNVQDDSAKFSRAQWIQGNTPPGGHVRNIFAGPEGTLYAVSPTGLYRFTVGATAWTRMNANVPIDKSFMPMAASKGTLYIVSVDEIFTSGDRGETWNPIGSRPKGYAVGLIIRDSLHTPITMYLALQDKGVFRSTDGGIKWDTLNDGLRNERISAIAAVGEIVFVGTNRGLYRLDSDIWKKLPVGASQTVYSLAVFNNNLYVATGPDLPHHDSDIWKKLPVDASQTVYSLAVFNNNLHAETGPYRLGFMPIEAGKPAVPKSEVHAVRIFHSADLGASWTEIMHIDKPDSKSGASGITVLAAGETILTLGTTQSRSTDGGHTWTEFEVDTDMHMTHSLPVSVAANETTFYKAGASGIHRTTDSGKSWHLFMDGIAGTRANSLIVFNNRLYVHTGYEVYQSTDEGGTWKKLSIAGELVPEETPSDSVKQDRLGVYTSFDSQLMVDGNTLYFVSPERHILRIYRLSADGNTLIPVQDFSTSDHESVSPLPEKEMKVKAIVVNNSVFYAEYRQRLFKWKLGDPKWTDTGLINTDKQPNTNTGFKVAISEETVYVGKRDGQLFQSLDSGKNWKDITLSLPLRFTHFNEILFVGSTVYVATDGGVLASQTGEHWHVITDNLGERSIINRFAIEDITVYGAGDAGVYRLDNLGKWKQISSEVLGEVISLAVINNRLYTAINERGIFHISLSKE